MLNGLVIVHSKYTASNGLVIE